jgi:hypothetical protein
MLRPSLFLIVLAGCVGCAETQSQQAFTPRRAAESVPPVTVPNQSAERIHNLAESLDRSLLAQEEDESMMPGRQGAIADKQPMAPDVREGSDSRASKTVGVEP